MTPDLLLQAFIAGCNLALAIHDDVPPEDRQQFWRDQRALIDWLKAACGHLESSLVLPPKSQAAGPEP